MAKEKSGRSAVTRSFSIDPQTDEQLKARLRVLKPRVKGLSHYVQLLIEQDMKSGGDPEGSAAIREWCAMEGSNLRPPPCQLGVLASGDAHIKSGTQIADLEGCELHTLPDVLAFSAIPSPLAKLPIAA